MNHPHHREKVQFQIERIAFFSDALIAIAVTLLIIEIKAPHIEPGARFSEQLDQLKHLVPEFISFTISFAIIISQWVRHHELFGNLINYDKKLIRLNSCFLFIVALIPFSTAYFAHNNITEVSLPYLIYGFSLIMLTVLNFLLFRHVVSKKKKLYDKSYTAEQIKWLSAEYLLFPVAIMLGLITGLIDLKFGILTYAVVMQFHFYIRRQKRRIEK
jgi:uncharacterized membrane protein